MSHESRLGNWVRCATAGLAVGLMLPGTVSAQLVRGRVLESGDNTPIPRAMVELRLPNGQVASRGLSGPAGAFAITAPVAGRAEGGSPPEAGPSAASAAKITSQADTSAFRMSEEDE